MRVDRTAPMTVQKWVGLREHHWVELSVDQKADTTAYEKVEHLASREAGCWVEPKAGGLVGPTVFPWVDERAALSADAMVLLRAECLAVL